MTFKQDQRLINMLLDVRRCGHLEQFSIKGSDDLCRNTIDNPSEGSINRAFEGAKCAPEDANLSSLVTFQQFQSTIIVIWVGQRRICHSFCRPVSHLRITQHT